MTSSSPEWSPRPAGLRWVPGLLCIVVLLVLLALGTWQVRRLAWKTALIAQVEARVHAAPVPAPPPARWSTLEVPAEAYRHVRLSGHYLWSQTVRVQASTELGTGFWLLTPLQVDARHTVLINRGFLADHTEELPPPPTATDEVTGLLRVSEPGGRLFRPNQPQAGRWYSRDVMAIAAALQLADAAPFFIDADAEAAATASPNHPVAGLTVISFPNNHLVYALTWYALAAMAAFGLVLLWRDACKPA